MAPLSHKKDRGISKSSFVFIGSTSKTKKVTTQHNKLTTILHVYCSFVYLYLVLCLNKGETIPKINLAIAGQTKSL